MPAKTWQEIQREDERQVFMSFVYPLIGLCGLVVLVGSLFEFGWSGPQSFQRAMVACCVVAVAQFGGYFLASYAIHRMGLRWYALLVAPTKVQQFAGYALAAPFLLEILSGAFPTLEIITWPLRLYTVYVVWEGAPILMGVTEQQRLSYTLWTSALLLMCPTLIDIAFTRLMVMF